MRNLKKLLFIAKLLLLTVAALGILITAVVYATRVFFICVVLLFLISLWFVCDDFVE